MEALPDRTEVEREQIAVLEDALRRGDAVDDLVVHRRADGRWERRAPVAEERRGGAPLADVGLGDGVEIHRRLPGGHGGEHRVDGIGDDPPRLAHLLHLGGGLVDDHSYASSRSDSASTVRSNTTCSAASESMSRRSPRSQKYRTSGSVS